DRAEVARKREALRDQIALGVGEPGRVIHVVLEHARIGGAEHGERHIVGDGENGVLEELEGNRVHGLLYLPPRISRSFPGRPDKRCDGDSARMPWWPYGLEAAFRKH